MKCGDFFWSGLQLALIILKLCKVIDISWWLVFIPVYILIGILVLYVICEIIELKIGH